MVTAMNDSSACVTLSGTGRDVVPDAGFNPGRNANYFFLGLPIFVFMPRWRNRNTRVSQKHDVPGSNPGWGTTFSSFSSL
jgi:hypothetical protein